MLQLANVFEGSSDNRNSEFERIVGNSPALEVVINHVRRVGPTDTTVLIQGETGTGKELIAQAIHNVSPRYSRRFIKVNCGAIPLDLLESEIFGHEKGAFTGAVAQRIGRFEMANQGTVFLDEIGDIPLALQPKLLRVLQEHEFERLGSSQTHKVDVRVIAATHRDLAKLVGVSVFRSDLYYRLNVFPISVPALRERRQDIPALVSHFVKVISHRLSKRIDEIPIATMAALEAYSWPGNIRELQNLIERAVILANDTTLPNPLGSTVEAITWPTAEKKLADIERDIILRVLEQLGWVIGGANGAAARLGLKRTTFIHKMKKLGINRAMRNTGKVSAHESLL